MHNEWVRRNRATGGLQIAALTNCQDFGARRDVIQDLKREIDELRLKQALP
ncbi:hypothetical protein [Mesorhizobium sp.]|nr:hypothetical protein [Mesorhizobium sp.]